MKDVPEGVSWWICVYGIDFSSQTSVMTIMCLSPNLPSPWRHSLKAEKLSISIKWCWRGGRKGRGSSSPMILHFRWVNWLLHSPRPPGLKGGNYDEAKETEEGSLGCCCSVDQWYLTLGDPMDCSMPSFPVLHHLPGLAQMHVHWVSDAIQLSRALSLPSPPAFNPSQHQRLFYWVGSSHQVTKVLELQLQHQSFQWLFRIDFLGERGYGFLWTWVQILPLVWTAPQGTGEIPELSGSEHATPSRSIPIYTIPTSDSSSKLNHFFVDCFWTLDHGQILSSPGSMNLGGKLWFSGLFSFCLILYKKIIDL